ncbi:MAG: single-stranded-DNA-specific exonuclease RecJ [Saprospiraceae bacterium]
MRKRWTLIPADEEAVSRLHGELRIHPVLCRVLVQRGISTFDEAKAFFRPSLDDLHDPFMMKNMDRAVDRVLAALRSEEKILLYGDYDVDGTTSVALMFEFLSGLGAKPDYYLPDRHKEGYGVSREGVEYARETGTSLIIAMDCGIRAVEQVENAQRLGIDFIVCDHHLPSEELPGAVAVLDPKQAGCAYPYKELSGCGVAFKLAQAINSRLERSPEHLWQLLDLLVLSIAADIVPMTGENRVLAHFGLKKLNKTERPGLKALIESSGRHRPLDINDIVFGLAPMINAAGRLSDARHAVQLMLANEKFVAADYARLLNHRNTQRKTYNEAIVREAREMLDADPGLENRKSIVLFHPGWHKGVLGIAASRLVELYCRPVILLCESNGQAVGSARSVNGFNIHDAIAACSDLLVNFGGHDHAAGLTMEVDQVPAFTAAFEAAVQGSISEEMLVPELKVNAVVSLSDLSPTFWRVLRQFAPFGPQNRRPVFVAKNVRDAGYSRLLKGNHLRLSVHQEEKKVWTGIAFGKGEDFHRLQKSKQFHIAFNLEEDTWQGNKRLRLLVKDLWF